MENDGVLYAFTEDSCVIKLEGSVKYTTIATDFERFVDDLVDKESVLEVIIDMRECTYIDSTDLGILARITVSQMQKNAPQPVLLYKIGSDIGSILKDVGFNRVFNMVEDHDFGKVDLKEVEKNGSESELKTAKMMLDAHQLLVDLNEGNKEKFSAVVDFMKENVDSLSRKSSEQ